jgi:hypothetical protein
MKVYFSMPISGHDVQERIDHAKSAKDALLNMYSEVVTPFDACPYDPNKSYGQCMKECIAALLECDKIIFDKGWYDSNGCRIEAEVARGCQIEIETL